MLQQELGDLRNVCVQIHLGEQDQRGRVVGIDRPGVFGDQPRITITRIRLALAPAGAPCQGKREALTRQPVDPIQCLGKGPRGSLGVMQFPRIVIEADAKE